MVEPAVRGEAGGAFDANRRRLAGIAYRMLGSVADAEDIVQDAWLRWALVDHAAVADPTAYLVRLVTRLCLDQLRSARVRRETYLGPWLPEPVVEAPDDGIEDDISMALMLALERLSPLERAAFLLREMFGVGFAEIARTLDREEAACRQLVARARRHVHAARPRFAVPPEEGARVAAAFFQASRSGDVAGLTQLLAAGVTVRTDGGGKAPAALNPIVGRDKVLRFFQGIARKVGASSTLLRTCVINGLPGLVTREHGGLLQTTALELVDGRIAAIYVVRNPDKLRHLAAAGVERHHHLPLP